MSEVTRLFTVPWNLHDKMDRPFSDKEKRFVLVEAIKTSSVPVDKLLAFVHETDVQPVWTEMLLPFGRFPFSLPPYISAFVQASRPKIPHSELLT